jgi:hypothetical protein
MEESQENFHKGHGCHGGCCGDSKRSQQAQLQAKKVDRVQEQKKLGFYTLDIYARLLGVVEQGVGICQVRAGQQPLQRVFHGNLVNHELDDLQFIMMDLEGFCDALLSFEKYAKKENLKKVTLPREDEQLWEILAVWRTAIDSLPDAPQEIQASKRILKYVVDHICDHGEVSDLPDELHELILSKAERDRLAREYIEKNQFDIISMVRATQNLSDKTCEQVDQLSQSDEQPALLTQPRIQVDPEDLNFRKQDGSHLKHYHNYNPEHPSHQPSRVESVETGDTI